MPLLRFILLLAVCAAPTAAWAHTITLPLQAGARVQVSQLSDGFTVGLFVRGIDAATLKKHLHALGPEHIETLSPSAKETVAYLRFAERVTLAKATLAGGGRHKPRAMAINLEVTTLGGREAVLAHALGGPLPLPASLDADLLRDADHQLLQGHVAQAELQLQQLKKNYPLHAWVMLRMGDVAVRKQQLSEACELYSEASHEGLERTASLMALLRARVLGCPHKTEPPWDRLLSRDAIDDPVGQRISDEAAWALGYEKDLATLHVVRGLEGHFYNRTIDRSLRQSLVARLIRFESPLGVAALAERSSMLVGHPEAFDLDLSASRAWCFLGSPSSWKQRSHHASTWMRLTDKERHHWQEQSSACALAPLPPLHLASHTDGLSLPEQHLQTLRRRLAAANKEATVRFPPPAPPAAHVAEADAQGAADAPPDQSAMPNKEQP